MKKLSVLLGAALSISAHASVMKFDTFSLLNAVTPTADCDKTCADRKTEFRYVVYVGKEIYCYWDEKKSDTGTNFDALATHLENSITSKTTETEYYLTLREWASSFHDGHVNAMAGDDMSGFELFSAPIRVEVLAPATDHEKLIVTGVDAGADGVSVGDEIVKVDGTAAADAITAIAARETSGSTARMRRFFAARRIVDVMGIERGSQPIQLELVTAKGEHKTASLARKIVINAKPVHGGGAGGPPATGADYISAKILPNGMGYLRIDAFGGSQDEFLFDEAMDRLAFTSGLIIDLRRNGGGDLSGDRILARLTDKNIVRYKRSENMSPFIMASRPENFLLPHADGAKFSDWHNLDVKANSSKQYTKPVVVLISPNCFSACDTFSASLKANGLAKFVGEGTGGGTGTPLVFDLENSGYQFRYSVIRGLTAKTEQIEGVGTLPDVYAEPTIEDRVKGTDSQLAKAIEVISGVKLKAKEIVQFSHMITPIGDQSFDSAPTAKDAMDLSRIKSIDEL